MDWWNKDFADTWTRNWEVEEEELHDTLPNSPIIFNWSSDERNKLVNNKKPIPQLLIACGSAASIFLHLQFPSNKVIGSIIIPEISLAGKSLSPSINDNSCLLYRVDTPSLILVVCQYDVPDTRVNEWASVLFQNILPEKVYIFSTVLEIDFQRVVGLDKATPPCLRIIQTDKARQEAKPTIKYLESPLMLDKLPAAIITYAQIFNLYASLYVSVEDHRLLGSDTLSAWETILKDIVPTNSDSFSKNYLPTLKTLKKRKENMLFL